MVQIACGHIELRDSRKIIADQKGPNRSRFSSPTFVPFSSTVAISFISRGPKFTFTYQLRQVAIAKQRNRPAELLKLTPKLVDLYNATSLNGAISNPI